MTSQELRKIEKISIDDGEFDDKGFEEEQNFFIIHRIMTEKFNCPFCYHIPIEVHTTVENDTIIATGKGICRRCHNIFDIPKLDIDEMENLLDKRVDLYRKGKLRI